MFEKQEHEVYLILNTWPSINYIMLLKILNIKNEKYDVL